MDTQAPQSPKQPLLGGVLTEKDFFRQIASNLTKEHISKAKTNQLEDTKQVFTQYLK